MSMGENAENGTGGSQNNFAQYDGQAIDRLNAFGLLSGDEKTELAKMALPRRTVERGEAIRETGRDGASLFLLLEGWAASAITFQDGSRQLTSVSLPGDLLGLPSLSVVEPIDTLLALSKVVVCDIPAANFAEMFTNMPRLATILFLVSQEERLLAMERLSLMGRASAASRLAAFVLRLHERLGQGLDEAPMSFSLPLTQVEIGDLIGISAVHVNAVLKQAREKNIMSIRSRELHILDFNALVETAGVQPWQRADPFWLKSSKST